MNETGNSENKNSSAKKNIALGLSMIFVLCIGIVWGYVARDSMPDECLSYDIPRQAECPNQKIDNQAGEDINPENPAAENSDLE